MQYIETKIKRIVSEQLDVPIENITNEMHFIKDLGGDSLDTVEMLLSLEDEFEITIDDDVAETIETVQMAIDLVAQELK